MELLLHSTAYAQISSIIYFTTKQNRIHWTNGRLEIPDSNVKTTKAHQNKRKTRTMI